MKYFKYKFNEIPDLSEHACDSVHVGHPVITEAEFNEQGELVTPAEFDTSKHMVDIIWHTDEPEGFEEFRVVPTTHRHWFAGMEGLWGESNDDI